MFQEISSHPVLTVCVVQQRTSRGSEFTLSLTHLQMKSVLSPQCLERFGRCRIFKCYCFNFHWLFL